MEGRKQFIQTSLWIARHLDFFFLSTFTTCSRSTILKRRKARKRDKEGNNNNKKKTKPKLFFPKQIYIFAVCHFSDEMIFLDVCFLFWSEEGQKTNVRGFSVKFSPSFFPPKQSVNAFLSTHTFTFHTKGEVKVVPPPS